MCNCTEQKEETCGCWKRRLLIGLAIVGLVGGVWFFWKQMQSIGD